MSKLPKKITTLFLLWLTVSFLNPSVTYALSGCPNPNVQVEPTPAGPFFSNSTKARFTIDVDRKVNEAASSITDWRMVFQCLGPLQTGYREVIAKSSTDDRSIYLDLNNTNGCEFDPNKNPITVRVQSKVNGNFLDFCTASYSVINRGKLCKLNLNPVSGFTVGQAVEVSGSDITTGGNFILLFDNKAIWWPNPIPFSPTTSALGAGNIPTPTFSGYKIPTDKMTIGSHTVSLHAKKPFDFTLLNPLSTGPLIVDNINQLVEAVPVCSVSFTVGTAANPGSVTGSTGGTLSTIPNIGPCSIVPGQPSSCSFGGGKEVKECTLENDKNNPGIATAIGCIHTTPAGFVKDFLTFTVAAGGGIAFLMMLLGAFGMITSAGNPDALKAATDRFTSAIIGLLFVIFAVLLMQIIGVGILAIPGFTP